MGLLYERAAVEFWKGVADRAQGPDTAGEPDRPRMKPGALT